MKLTIYFDFGSPYAYLAWQRVRLYPARYSEAHVEFQPASAGHIFKQDGTAPNVTMPNQKQYLLRDVKRWADYYGAPFAPPTGAGAMPVNAINAMRMWFNAGERKAQWMETVYHAYFQHGLDISNLDILAELARAAGVPGPAAIDEEAKAKLISNTQVAYDAGAPGVPFMLLDDEPYWGNDRLLWIEAKIAGQRVVA